MIAAFFILLLIALDQAVKYWAVTVLQQVGIIPLISGVFQLQYIENRGVAFSMFQNQPIALMVVPIIVVIGMIVLLVRKWARNRLGYLSLCLIISGAIGNLIDRFTRGFVVDMFDFVLIHFPVFNVADIFIVVGGFLFAYYFCFQHDKVKSA